MSENTNFIRESVMRDMSEGVMTIGLDGVIGYINPAAAKILDRTADELAGQKFSRCFFEYAENDAFNQTILDAVYGTTTSHSSVVPYFTGSETFGRFLSDEIVRQLLEEPDGLAMGGKKRTKYDVVGSHVNLCGRIESYTVGGQVLVSPKTREMIDEPGIGRLTAL